MRAVASGSIKKPGLSRATAQEYVGHYPTGRLPEKADGKKLQRKRQLRKSKPKPRKSVHGAYS